MAGRPETDRGLTDETGPSWLLVVLGAGAFALVAALVVPWQPVPGGWPGPVEASRIFTPDEIARAEAYAHDARLLGWASLLVSTVVALGLGFSAVGSRLLGRLRLPWPIAVAVLAALVLLIGRLATLPIGLLGWQQRRANGLSEQSLAGYLLDQGRGYGVGWFFTAIALVVLVGCARRWQRAWPLVAGGLAAGLVLVSSWLHPVLIEPLFNDFTPLDSGPLRTRIMALAEQEGVPLDEVLVADASRRTTTLNAYVSGIGGSRRVVVYDTLLEQAPRDEVVSVVAHELAHARHRDVETGTVLGALGGLVGIGLLGLVVASPGVRRRAGVAGMADPRVVALVLALGSIGTLAASPVESTISRRIEMRADVDALRATGDPEAFIRMQRRLALTSLADPTPPVWAQVWFGSHPTTLQRIAVAATFAQWR